MYARAISRKEPSWPVSSYSQTRPAPRSSTGGRCAGLHPRHRGRRGHHDHAGVAVEARPRARLPPASRPGGADHGLEGEVEQWLESEKRTLHPGDSIYIPAGVVHASFNSGDGKARMHVVPPRPLRRPDGLRGRRRGRRGPLERPALRRLSARAASHWVRPQMVFSGVRPDARDTRGRRGIARSARFARVLTRTMRHPCALDCLTKVRQFVGCSVKRDPIPPPVGRTNSDPAQCGHGVRPADRLPARRAAARPRDDARRARRSPRSRWTALRGRPRLAATTCARRRRRCCARPPWRAPPAGRSWPRTSGAPPSWRAVPDDEVLESTPRCGRTASTADELEALAARLEPRTTRTAMRRVRARGCRRATPSAGCCGAETVSRRAAQRALPRARRARRCGARR